MFTTLNYFKIMKLYQFLWEQHGATALNLPCISFSIEPLNNVLQFTLVEEFCVARFLQILVPGCKSGHDQAGLSHKIMKNTEDLWL